MRIDEYKQLVIELFRSGTATDAQWDEMAKAVLDASENSDAVPAIDKDILAVD